MRATHFTHSHYSGAHQRHPYHQLVLSVQVTRTTITRWFFLIEVCVILFGVTVVNNVSQDWSFNNTYTLREALGCIIARPFLSDRVKLRSFYWPISNSVTKQWS